MAKTITVDIAADGTASIDLAGYQGKGCDSVVAAFRGGDTVTESKDKRERAAEGPQAEKVRERQ